MRLICAFEFIHLNRQYILHSAPIQHEYFEFPPTRYPARGTCVKQLSGTCNAVRNAT